MSVTKNTKEAGSRLEALAELGYADAYYSLGRSYAVGEFYPMDVIKAKEMYEIGMKLGSLKSFYGYALLHTTGHGVLKDEKLAKDYFEAGYLGLIEESNEADPVALYIIGCYYYYGFHVKRYVSTAIEYLRKSADLGYSEAQFLLGSIYEQLSDDVPKYKETFDNYSKAAMQGHAYAQYGLALMYIVGEAVKKDFIEAKKWLEAAVKQNHYIAAYTLGMLYYEGELGKVSYDKAFDLFLQSADQGYKDGQYYVGIMYKNGQGVEKDLTEAITYLTLAANQNDMNAQYVLGITYFQFHGKPHYDKSFLWLNKAADQKHPYAQYNLGVMYQNGDYVEQNYEKASILYRQAAQKDVVGAMYNLGMLYMKGLGVTKSESTATYWWKQAADKGHEPSKKYLNSIENYYKKKIIKKKKID